MALLSSFSRHALPLVLTLAAAGCGGGGEEPMTSLDAGADASLDARPDVPIDVVLPPSPLMARTVPYNAAGTNLGAIAAVAELDSLTVLFGARGMQVLAGGSVSATDNAVTMWRSAGVVPAGDGTMGNWVVGLDVSGRVWRMRDRMRLEDVTARYALAMHPARSVAALSANRAAFGYDGGFAIANGMRVTLWSDPAFAYLVGGGGRLAARTDTGVKVFDVATERMVMFNIANVTSVAFDATDRLVVTAGGKLYAENMAGELEVRVDAMPSLRGLVRSGPHVWLVAGGQLALWQGGEVHTAPDVMVPMDGQLLSSPSGDVWVLAGGTLSRYSFVDDPDLRLWEETVRPVFARRCVPCHLPGGTGNRDLTTYRAWVGNRMLIRMAVIVDRAMPPPPGRLTDEERAAVDRWLGFVPPPVDGGADGGRDAVVADVTMDARADVGVDASVDAPMDVRPDVAMDVRPDVAMDVRPDAPADVRVDAPADVRVDAPADVRVDAGAVTYTAAVDPIIQRACVRCHGASGGLNMSTVAMAYTALVNTAAAGTTCRGGGRIRVVPGDPMGSLLYQKLMGTQDCGNAMPRGAAMLPAAELDVVRRWIMGGALR